MWQGTMRFVRKFGFLSIWSILNRHAPCPNRAWICCAFVPLTARCHEESPLALATCQVIEPKKITAFTFCPRKGTAVCQLQVEAQQHDETTCQSWTPFILIASFMYGRSAICTPWWVGYLLLDGFFNHFNKTSIHLSFKVRYPCVHVSILVFDRWLIAGWWILNPYKGNAWQRGRMGLRCFQVSKHISCHFVWCFCRGKSTKD